MEKQKNIDELLPEKYKAMLVSPKNDDEYLAEMTKCIFTAGLNWKVIENKWDGFLKAYHNFSVSKVAGFSASDVETMLNNPDIVRNEKKIYAIIENAREMISLKSEYGSFKDYIGVVVKEHGDDDDAIVNTVSKRFKHLGPTTAFMFLKHVGLELPNKTCNVLKAKGLM